MNGNLIGLTFLLINIIRTIDFNRLSKKRPISSKKGDMKLFEFKSQRKPLNVISDSIEGLEYYDDDLLNKLLSLVEKENSIFAKKLKANKKNKTKITLSKSKKGKKTFLSSSKIKNFENEAVETRIHKQHEMQETYKIDEEGGELEMDDFDLEPASDQLGPGLRDLPIKALAFKEDYELERESTRLWDETGMKFKSPLDAADFQSDDEDSEYSFQEDSPVDDPYDME